MSSSPVDRMSGASTPTLLAMSSYSSNRLHEELNGLKRWRQMYDSAMNEKNEELQKLQLINQRQAQSLNDSIIQIEQQTTTINSMKQNEILLEKKVAKLEELHHVLKKNVTKLEKTVSQCEFVRVDLERLYEHQERNVKSLADRMDSTIESKLQNLQSQLKSVEQLYEQARIDLQKQIEENNQSQIYIVELTNKLVVNENEINQLQSTNINSQFKINELNGQINQSKQTIELIQNESQSKLNEKNQEIEQLQKRIDSLVLKIDGNQEEIFKLQQQINEFHEKSSEIHQLREKQSEQLLEQIKTSTNEIEELKSKNIDLQNEINQFHLQIDKTQGDLQKQIADYAKQSIEYEHRFEEQSQMIHEKQTNLDELKEKHDDLLEKIDLSEEEILQLTKENEELRAQNHMLIQETDERNEQIKQKDVIVEATNIEIGEKDKEIEELKAKVISLEERLSKNQNLLTSLRSSMGEKDAKIKRLEQGPLPSQPSPRPTAIRRTGPITHPLATQTKASLPNNTTKPNPREKRMLPPPAANDLTSTPKKIVRLSQTKAAIDQAHALEKSFSILPDDDRDEIASNTSVASLFEYLKKI